MVYTRRNWANAPATTTPITATALNNIEDGVEEATNAVRGRLSEATLEETFVGLSMLPVIVSPEAHGVDPTGAADSAPGIQAAINEAFASVIAAQKAANNDATNIPIKRDVDVPAGLYKIDSALTLKQGVNLRLSHAAVIRAGTSMGAMLDSSPSTLLQRAAVTGGVWDCNALAQTAIYLRWAVAMILKDFRVNDPTGHAIIVGDPTSTQTSYEVYVDYIDLYRPRGTASPVQTNVISSGVTFTDSGDLVTVPAHGATVGDTIVFGTITSTTGVTAGTTYYVKTVPSANTMTISATLGGATLGLTTDGSAASATLVRGYASLWMRNVTDSYVANIVPRGFDVGVRNDGGNNSFFRVHPWSPTGQPGPSICFDDNGSNTRWIDCYADSPSGIGFRFRGSNAYSMTDCTMYMSASGADNAAYAVLCDGIPALSLKGGSIYAVDSSHRWKQDVLVTGGGPSSLNITFMPARNPSGDIVTRTFGARWNMHALSVSAGSDAGAFQVNNANADMFRGFNSSGTLVAVINKDGGIQPGKVTGIGGTLWSGSGAPTLTATDGDFYFRTDTPGTANQRIYVRSGGAWVGIV